MNFNCESALDQVNYSSCRSHVSVDITCAGANITMSDLSQYRVRIYPALSMSLRGGLSIHTLRPPSSGAILAFMLRVLGGMVGFSTIIDIISTTNYLLSVGSRQDDRCLVKYEDIQVVR